MKKLFALLLVGCMVFALCACGNEPAENNKADTTTVPQATGEEKPSTPNVTEPQVTDPQVTEPEKTGATYTIKVVDEGGNPVGNVMVQLCSDSGCMPQMTNAEGVAVYENKPEISGYKASVTVYPEGYEAASEQTDYYFEDAYEVTITIKAVA